MSDSPVFAVPDTNLVPVSNYPADQIVIPPSRMFLIKKGLAAYREKMGDGQAVETYDASQGDGGASLSGVPRELLERAFALQLEQGTGYDSPHGTPRFWQAVAEDYWQLDAATGWGPGNVAAVQGGRDGLLKVYQAMIRLGTGRIGDVLLTSAVPWISYNWGPYALGMNVLRAPGDAQTGWAITPEGIAESVAFAAGQGRRVAGLVITSPDNPTGATMPAEAQIALAKSALEQGIPYVLFDWIYHWVTSGAPQDINAVLTAFTPEERQKLIFLDGITKSLGGSNIRSAHLLADETVIRFISSQASHGVIVSFFSQAVAIAAYEMGFARASAPITRPTAESRAVLGDFLRAHDFRHVIGDGYYAFVHVGEWIARGGFGDSAGLGEYLAQEHGVAVVPGVYFSAAGADWIRFSYALPPARTAAAAGRLLEGLNAIR
ncbi:MAG: aminotransferase class I/II-fold pyridoxal phosphate-dependent enzyme [Anaerolineae bacterium]|nr:aminotransferase class I/II-fold pyridoxal phosphate-dependent enzyme [Anaerolineae bacterium]